MIDPLPGPESEKGGDLPGALLASGRMADTHVYGEGHVVKLFRQSMGRSSVEGEARAARVARAAGLPTPVVGDLITVHGRPGLVYERVNGPSMFALLEQRPWRIIDFARRLARLHALMHAEDIEAGLPPLRRKLEYKLRHAPTLPESVRSAALTALESMPDGQRLCHGDFHPGNVMMPVEGETIIDWADAAIGRPLADVARAALIMQAAVVSGFIENPLLRRMARFFPHLYLRFYFRLRPGGRQEYRAWFPIVAAARLSENIPEEEAWLVVQARSLRK